MEHKDNASFANNYLRGNIDEFSLQQNQQNLVENRQIASGFGPGGIVSAVDEIDVSIGGKFVEEENDEEWKYIQEVQRSEKQQVLEGVENVDGVGVMFVDYECGGDGQSLQAEVDDEEEAGIIKNDGDFSTTSNTTSTTVGEEENSTAAEEELHEMQQAIDKSKAQPMFQVGMEAEVTKLLPQKNNSPSTIEESSLATVENSEMLEKEQEVYKKPEQYTDEESEVNSGCMFSSSPPFFATNGIKKPEENENQSNTAFATAAGIESHNYPEENITTHKSPERPSELDFEMHSSLNPEAKEFVPIHSNPTCPISPNKSHDILDFESSAAEQTDASPVVAYSVEDNKENEEFFVSSGGEDLFTADVGDFAENLTLSSVDVSPHPSAVPRHMIASNDVGLADVVLAQSPHKGRGLDMETISLPAETVFGHEAAMRPHEIEQEDDDGKASDEVEAMTNGMGIGNHENKSRTAGDSNFHDDTGAEHEMQMPETEDYSDFQNRLDHGPETSVDLDMDSPDMMKQSVYVENDVEMQQQPEIQHEHEQIEEPAIEELLNSVQPIPTDSESLNSSFTEGMMNTVNKEMLNVEEKEVVSHSPSIEELNMRYQNEYNVYSSETSKTLIDMDNAGHMQDSFYMERTPAPVDMEAIREPTEEISTREIVLEAVSFHATDVMSSDNDIIGTDTSHPQEINESSPHNEDVSSEAILTERPAAMAPEETQQFTDFTSEKVNNNESLVLSSPQSNERQFIEEAKEDLDTGNEIADLEQEMGDLQLKHDGSLQKVDEVAASATPINENPFELIAPEFQCEVNASPAFEAEENSQRKPPLDDPFTDDVVYKEVESKLQAMMTEERTKSPLVQPSADPEMDDANYASMIETGFVTGSSVPEAELLEKPSFEGEADVSSAATSSPEPKIHSPSMDVAKTDASVNEPILLEEVTLSPTTPVAETTVEAPAVPITSDESAVAVKEVAVNEPPVNQASASEGPVSTTKAAEPEVDKEDVLKAMAVGVAVATSATVAAAAAATVKKLDPAKKAVSSKTTKAAAQKTKLAADSKKPTDIKKPGAKPTTTATAARRRTAPSAGANKSTATGLPEKRASASSATMTSAARPAALSAAARKSITSRSISAKPPTAAAAKTTSNRATAASSSSKSTLNTARNGIAPKTTASRPLTATRKLTTSTSAASAPVSAAATASKPQPAAGGAPIKPTTLGITAKPKALSPRPRITISQVSKSGGGLPSTAAKSPLKTAATAATNLNGKTTSSSTNASSTNRTKTTSAPTKTFTARPAPKTTSAPITSTTNHLGRGITIGSTTKTSTITSSSSVLRGKMSPTKTSVAPISKPKTKDVILPKSAAKAATTVGKASARNAIKEKQPLMEATVDLVEPPKLNGEPLGHTANGDANYNHGAENGLTEQGEMSLMEGNVA